MSPNPASIAELAYQLWLRRGCPEGSEELDWREAERQLATEGSSTPASDASPDGKVGSAPETTFPTRDPASAHSPDSVPTDAGEERQHGTDTAARSASERRPRVKARAQKS
jgi:DUF2934 family protein